MRGPHTVPLLALLALSAGCASPLTSVLVVRHAEKRLDQGDDPELDEKGAARAQRLASLLAKSEPAAIYATQWRRTSDTVRPLADRLGLPIQTVDAKATDLLARKIRAEHEGRTVLVAGHSNTVNRLISALGGPTLPDLDDSEYDNVYLLTISGSQAKLHTFLLEMP